MPSSSRRENSNNSSFNFGSIIEPNNHNTSNIESANASFLKTPRDFAYDSSNVSGPYLLNLPSDKNPGDNDPETEDEDDCNNDRAYLEAKFKMMDDTSKRFNSTSRHNDSSQS